MRFMQPTYDTEAVRLMLEKAKGQPVTNQDVWNLSREGHALESALVRRGAYNPARTRKVLEQMTRRRLAATLGRTSERLPGEELAAACDRCKAIAVTWEGKTLCENGHLS